MTKQIYLFVFVLIIYCLGVVEGGRRDECSTGSSTREQLNKIKQLMPRELNTTCLTCEVAFYETRNYIETHNYTEKDIEEIVDFFCVALKIEHKDVCADVVLEFQGLLFYLLSERQFSPAFACGVIGICPAPEFPKWNITLTPTPPPIPYPAPNPKNPSMFVLHLTDIHIDPEYTPGLSAECGEPICCRPPNPPGNPAAGQWGDYRCDLSPSLYNNMLQWIASNLPNLSYAIFTGDMPPHDVWSINRTEALNDSSLVLNTYLKYLPKVKLYPATGNHEAVPVNEFAPSYVTGQWNMGWLYDGLAQRWAQWLPAAALTQVKKTGYYTTTTPDGVRIISLNTNYGCNNMNWFLTIPGRDGADPDGMLQWLADTLDSAEKSKETVYLIKHIAPSEEDCGNGWWRNYFRIINRYKNIILGDFAGHTHADVFSVTYELVSNTTVDPLIMTYFPGSVTPYSNNNPGFRVYEIDSVTKAVIDYTEYAINLTLANTQGSPTWQPIYKARSAYSLADMSPSAWHGATLKMASNSTLLYQFWTRQGKDYISGTCNAACMRGTLCQLYNPPPDTYVSICGL